MYVFCECLCVCEYVREFLMCLCVCGLKNVRAWVRVCVFFSVFVFACLCLFVFCVFVRVNVFVCARAYVFLLCVRMM